MIEIAQFREIDDVGDIAHRRDAEGARDDRDVALRAAILQNQAAHLGAIVIEQRRRTHRAGDDDGVVGQVRRVGREAAADEFVQQPVGEIVEVVQALAQVGIRLPLHLGAGVVLHPLDRRLRRQPARHRFAKAAQPAAIVGDGAERFQDVARLARRLVANIDELVDRGPCRRDGGLQPRELERHVLGDDLLHDDPRLVQHHMPEANAFGDRRAGQRQGGARREIVDRGRQGLQFARGDHLREQHGGRLEDLDLLVDVDPSRLVLHHEHAERVAAAQHRNAEEGRVDLLPGFRAVGEGGMLLRIGEREAFGRLRDEPDQTFVRAHRRQMHGLPVQALRGVEFETAVPTQHVNGANLRDHVGSDVDDDAIEPGLGADRLRHDFAEPAQQQTGSAVSALHGPIL